VAKRVNGGLWRWFFFDGLKVVAEGTGQNDKIYYTNSPGVIGEIVCRDNNGTKYWYHFDRLGNVMGVTDSNGNVATLYTMEAFGNVLQITNGGDFSGGIVGPKIESKSAHSKRGVHTTAAQITGMRDRQDNSLCPCTVLIMNVA